MNDVLCYIENLASSLNFDAFSTQWLPSSASASIAYQDLLLKTLFKSTLSIICKVVLPSPRHVEPQPPRSRCSSGRTTVFYPSIRLHNPTFLVPTVCSTYIPLPPDTRPNVPQPPRQFSTTTHGIWDEPKPCLSTYHTVGFIQVILPTNINVLESSAASTLPTLKMLLTRPI